VVTEISWNPSNNPAHRYVAKIEFISAEDWGRELGYLFHDLDLSGEVSSEAQLEESDAGVAWAKIKAVYPKLNKKDVGQCDVKTLLDDPEVKALLGTTKTLRTQTAAELYKGVRVYVDGKSKGRSKSVGGKGDHNVRKIELWPLIKVVRIYTKANALSSGAVIVDLVSSSKSYHLSPCPGKIHAMFFVSISATVNCLQRIGTCSLLALYIKR
jgi:hypothetical protein